MQIIGGTDGCRTHYLLLAKQALSRLSYSPMSCSEVSRDF